MDPEGLWRLAFLVILLFLSAFFSASETALMSLSKIRLRHMVDEGIKGATVVNKLIEQPSKLLSTILVGNNIVNIWASALATSLALELFRENGVAIATLAMTLLVLIFGEITPKSLAAEYSEKASLLVAKPIYFSTIILKPLTYILNFVTNIIIKIFGGNIDQNKQYITEEELKTILDVGHEDGILETEERKMMYNVFEFGESKVKDVMTPRTNVTALDVSLSYDQVSEIFKKEGYSRIPVYRDTIDNIIGIIYLKDLFYYKNGDNSFDLSKLVREPYFTFEFKQTDELFEDMRKKRVHMSVVLDEYGGTAGIITMEDLVEEIVGEIDDEYDEINDEIKVIKEDEYIINGNARIDVVNEMIGINIETEDFDSIGGYVVGQFGRIPKSGESLEIDSIKFIIDSVDRNRIRKIKVLT